MELLMSRMQAQLFCYFCNTSRSKNNNGLQFASTAGVNFEGKLTKRETNHQEGCLDRMTIEMLSWAAGFPSGYPTFGACYDRKTKFTHFKYCQYVINIEMLFNKSSKQNGILPTLFSSFSQPPPPTQKEESPVQLVIKLSSLNVRFINSQGVNPIHFTGACQHIHTIPYKYSSTCLLQNKMKMVSTTVKCCKTVAPYYIYAYVFTYIGQFMRHFIALDRQSEFFRDGSSSHS